MQSLCTGSRRETNLSDHPSTVRPIHCRLAVWLAVLMCVSPMAALANRTDANTLTGSASVHVVADDSNDLILKQNREASIGVEDTVPSPPGQVSVEAGSADDAQPESSVNVPCLQSDPSGQEMTLDAADSRCDKPLEAPRPLGLRFGHRMRTRNSMLGDFDGVMFDYGLGNFAFNGIAGFPAASGGNTINPKNHLFGFSASSRKLARGWDMGGYMMEQRSVDQDGRSALGGAIRYSQANRSLLISADYDLLKHTLSRFMVSSAWRLLPTSTLSTTFDMQQSYLPTPQKNYLQQSIALTDGWTWGLPLDRIRDLSTDSATDVAAFGLSLSHALTHNIKLDSDISVLNVSKEMESDDLEASLSKYNEYYFYFKLTGKSLLLPGDSNTVTLRHNVSETSRLSSYLLDGSYDLSRQWHLTPRLQIDYRDNLADHSTQWSALPAVKVEYRLRKQAKINFKAAGEWRKLDASTDQEYHASYVVSLGYRTDF